MGLKAPRGWGWLTNPRKAAYNRIYYRTTIDPVKVLIGRGKQKRQNQAVACRQTPKRKSGFSRLIVLMICIGMIWFLVKVTNGIKALVDVAPASPAAPDRLISPTPPPAAFVAPAQRALAGPTPSVVPPVVRSSPPLVSVAPPASADHLREALEAQRAAQAELNAARDAVKARVALTRDYQNGKGAADEAKSKVDALRASGDDGLADASQVWIALASIPNRMLADAYASDFRCRTAQTMVTKSAVSVADARKQVAEAERLAALQRQTALAEQARQQNQDADSDTAGYGAATVRSLDGSSGAKDEHVSGYTRQNGTYVQSYNRRSSH